MEQVAILARVSTQGQDYERQVVELTDYCQRMNWEVVKVFANKVSGATRISFHIKRLKNRTNLATCPA